jgi:thiamine biosynthesis lipoprotein
VTGRQLLLVVFAALLPVASCRSGSPAVRKQTRLLMDTYVTIQALGRASSADSAIEAAFVRLEDISRKFNHLDSASPIYAFNTRNVPLTDPELVEVVRAAVAVSEASGGAFDITVEPLVRLWGFYGDHPAVPEQQQIDSCLKLVGYRNLVVESGRVTKRNPGTTIDLGGIAKGFALNEAAQVLRAGGVQSALVDIGGDVLAIGRKGNEKWRIGIRNPRGEGVVAVVAAEDLAAVTSGDYERCFWGPPRAGSGHDPDSSRESGHVPRDSVRYCHIIDPATGRPAHGVASATVLMRDPLVAQGWSKVLFIRGRDALPLIEQAGGIEGLLVTDKQEVIRSAGWPGGTGDTGIR